MWFFANKPYRVSVDVVRAQELCESRCGRPGLPVTNSPYSLCGRKETLNLNIASELRNCVEVDADVLGSLSLIVRTVYADVKKH